jgi:hypothetical protein
MRRLVWFGLLLLVAGTAGRVYGADQPGCPPSEADWLKRIHPVGGWHPYGGGLICWWNPHCFPCACGPDDYCRKPLPNVCRQGYPWYYQWGPPEACPPRGECARSRDCSRPLHSNAGSGSRPGEVGSSCNSDRLR